MLSRPLRSIPIPNQHRKEETSFCTAEDAEGAEEIQKDILWNIALSMDYSERLLAEQYLTKRTLFNSLFPL